MSSIRIGGTSLNQTPIDWDNNLSNIISAIEEARSLNVKILCLPELCITGYGCEDLFLSEWVPDTAMRLLHTIIPKCKDICVAVGLPFRKENSLFNVTCMIQDEKILGFYAKQILANDGIHYEHRWFKPWPSGKTTTVEIAGEKHPFGDILFNVYNIKVGLEICEDAWNTVRPACRLFEKGVQLIINPSASHFAFLKSKTREELVTTSSKTFNCGYLYVNQLGNESGRVIYDGDVIIAAKGKLLAKNRRFSFQKTELLYCDFLIQELDTIETHIVNDYDSKFEEFTHACSLALFDYLRKSRAKGYALSLSGGADSSSVAILVYEMVNQGIKRLGKLHFCECIRRPELIEENVHSIVENLLITAYQATKNSSEDTLNSARSLAASIGAKFYAWDIDKIVSDNTFIIEEALQRKLEWDSDDIALQNIQARVRSPLIWMLANISNHILLTTSNRSEGDVGYTTMDGDTSGSLAPIAGVDKTFLLEWLHYAQKELNHAGLDEVNNLSPTAELRPSNMDQTDEDDLMPYEILRQIESLAIHHRLPPIEVFKELLKKNLIDKDVIKRYLNKFYRLWSINQWKRERIAPSFHLDDFNVDPKTWCRFPILSGSFKAELEELNKL